jgi:hypothetical protein
VKKQEMMRAILNILAIPLSLFAASCGLAAPVTSVNAFAGVGRYGWVPALVFDSGSGEQSADAFVIAADPGHPDAIGRADARASAQFGSGEVYASSVSNGVSYVTAVANSNWLDTWTVEGVVGSGYGLITARITGTLDAINPSDDNPALAVIQYDVTYSSVAGNQSVLTFTQSFSPTVSGVVDVMMTGLFRFDRGVPFNISGLLNATASVPSQPWALNPPPDEDVLFFDGYARADFESTALITDVALPFGAYLVTESGTTYPTSQVPEPAGWATLLATFMAIAVVRRQRRMRPLA